MRPPASIPALLWILLVYSNLADGACPNCQALHRTTLAPCVCGDCLPAYNQTMYNECVLIRDCPVAGQFYELTSDSCRACTRQTFDDACGPCRGSSGGPCNVCADSRWRHQTTGVCTSRPSWPANHGQRGIDTLISRAVPIACSASPLQAHSWADWAITAAYCLPADLARLTQVDTDKVFHTPDTLIYRSTRDLIVRCHEGHPDQYYIPPYDIGANIHCDLLKCPANTVDHDDDPLTPCRRISPPSTVE